jgi:SSS family solute:Na+ symporter
MHPIDWSIIGAYVILVTVVGFLFIRRASGSVAEFFVAGRNLPWWLAGTSLVATSFAADTPLAITGIVAEKGIAGNWLWWNQVVAWALAIVFFARLWRRSGIITDAEFVELRYGGRPGAFLRGFKAVYTSFIFSTYTLAWVMLAMQKIVGATIREPGWVASLEQHLQSTFGLTAGSIDVWKWMVLIALFLVATLYSALSGYWGIVVTDLIQFVIAMAGSVLFAVYAVDAVGGMASLKAQLTAQFGGQGSEEFFAFLPGLHSSWMPVTTFVIYLSVLWWGDCGGFAAQRLFSTRSERDAILTSVWYSVASFVLRPWPWIAVAMVTLVYYPALTDREAGYPMLLVQILPAGLRGLMIASLLAAFMSTVDTHLNWNASYFVNDVYRRFLVRHATEAQCVRVSRLSTLGFAALAIAIAYTMTSIKDAWLVLFNLQAGIGLVLMLRWFWWRVNAWSEISAMVASLITTTALPYVTNWGPAERILVTVLICTPVWVTVTLLTKPADGAVLEAFYRKVRPTRLLWGGIARRCSEVPPGEGVGRSLAGWVLGALAIYAAMCAVGKLVLLDYQSSVLAFGACLILGVLIYLCFRGRRNPLAA